ncbi:general secretion pathway protein GspB [Noviherbaspirillum sedimenti]|uniref:Type II secretion system protein GspB C-terminal domain-containing protein n=1 Tax=Noviherbaspirillum sedimenti TaxID=2320865 RepID=A0A3A3GP46_9BURK|nr:general secretion pathway protein GspB [Noviherbaspirillum sedimenti]RJG04096.1 hypothetical protein D3878_22980 [Noviherbaspirillum sedimenti]
MSYILDALKKAEAERHIGQIPGLHVQPAAALPSGPAQPRAHRAWLAAAAALLVAGAALAWLRPWQAPGPQPLSPLSQPAAQTQAPSVKEKGTPPALPSLADAAAPAPQIVAISPPPAPPRPAAHSAKIAEKPRNASSAPPREARKSPADVAAAKPRAAPATPVPASDTDLKLSTALTPEPGTSSPRELPEQIHRELPNLTIGGYIYSDNPRERQLLVNKRLLHEGEEAAPGVILEKMLPKAAVFNYKGYRYRLAY